MLDFYKPMDIASRLGLTTGRVYQMLHETASNPIPHIRRGRAIIIPARAFEDWLTAQNEAACIPTAQRLVSTTETNTPK